MAMTVSYLNTAAEENKTPWDQQSKLRAYCECGAFLSQMEDILCTYTKSTEEEQYQELGCLLFLSRKNPNVNYFNDYGLLQNKVARMFSRPIQITVENNKLHYR